MNINRVGKQTKAFWRSQNKMEKKWMKETSYEIVQERLTGHAQGWGDGVKWARSQNKKKEAALGGKE